MQFLLDGRANPHVTGRIGLANEIAERDLRFENKEEQVRMLDALAGRGRFVQALLRGANELPLREKRMLALILAYSLLQLCGSPWLNETFSKEHISFFFKSENEPDYERPYISTHFDELSTVASARDMNQLHRNPSIAIPEFFRSVFCSSSYTKRGQSSTTGNRKTLSTAPRSMSIQITQ